MKLLNGLELAGFIKERQAKQVRSLKQAENINPKLAIIQVKDDPVINTYVNLKRAYGRDIGIGVDIFRIDQSEVKETVGRLNDNPSIHGIIIQLPLQDPAETDELCNMVSPDKDVDALDERAEFEPATPMAILWLLAGYNIDLKGKSILILGRGKLVGAPLEKILNKSGHQVAVADRSTTNLKELCIKADVIITATGSPAIIYPDMIKQNAVVVDAGVASEDGKTVGDVAEEVYRRNDLTITPAKGGVGPLTVCALFENVIRSARRVAGDKK